MNKTVTTLLISSLALGGFTVANADNDYYEKGEYSGKYCDKKGKGFGSRIERMTKHLGLNDEQVKQARAVRDNFHPQMTTLRDSMKDTRKQLREVMHGKSVNQDDVKKLATKMGDLKAEKIILHSKMQAEMNKILTVEQREKMKEFKKNRRYRDHD